MFKNLNPSALGVTGHQSEIIELALTYGFEGMDLNANDFITRVRRKGMPYARRLIDSANIRIGASALPIDWDVDDEQFKQRLADLPEMAEAIAGVGCTRFLVKVAPAGDKRPYHENFEFHRHRFADLCRAVQPHGIHLGVGFQAPEYLRREQAFQFIHDFDALTLLVNMVEADNVGILLNVWDLYVAGGTLDTIHGLSAEQIVAVEVAELAAEQQAAEIGPDSRLMPDAEGGRIDVTTILSVLREKGYDGPVTPVPSRGALPSKRRDLIVRRTGESIDRLWQASGLRSQTKPLEAAAEPVAPQPARPSEA